MTYKEFQAWCNERACDGCWGMQEAMLCIEVMKVINKLPFWKRKKVWNEIKDDMEQNVIVPINEKIKAWRGEQA